MTRFEIDAAERRAEARGLHTALLEIREDMARRAKLKFTRWQSGIARPEFQDSARNLADYLAFRRGDLAPFQPRLTALGLSSMSRAEAHVRPSLDAVLAALALIGEEGASPSLTIEFPPAEIFAAGPARLKARRDALFGASDARGTRIMVTLPAQAADTDLTSEILTAGADCLRIDGGCDGPGIWEALAAKAKGRKLQFDLRGPEIQLNEVQIDAPRLHQGGEFYLSRDLTRGKARRKLRAPEVTLTHPEVLAHLKVGSEVRIDQGKLRALVTEVEDGRALCEVQMLRPKGLRLKPGRTVSLPQVDLSIPALTQWDIEALGHAMRYADVIGFGFVQTVEDVAALIAAMEIAAQACGRQDLPAIMLRIETPAALRNLPELIVAAGGRVPVGVMIARSDLADDIGIERLWEIQEELLWLCEAAEVPVVWATQVLDGMLQDGTPSRVESHDAAMSQRAECVMLGKGPHIVGTVRYLRAQLERMDRYQTKHSSRLGALNLWHEA